MKTKIKLLCVSFVFLIALNKSYSQCSNFVSQYPADTQSTTSNSLVTVTSCNYGGEYSVYNVTAGQIYTWTTCDDTDFDTQLTLWDVTHTINYAYNDDNCGVQSTITWTATFTGVVHLLLSQYNCLSISTCMTVQWACTTCVAVTPSNDDCSGAIALTVGASCSFSAYTNANATASGGAPAPTCANYVGGDVWFSAVVPATGHLIIDTQIGVITDGGMALYTGTCGTLTQFACDDDESVNGLMPMIDKTGLSPGSTIYIRFWGYNGESGTFQICVYNAGNAPPIPTGLTATTASCTSINLSWNSSAGATSYDVYTCAGSSVINTSNTNYTVSGLNSNTYYDYKVRAVGSLGTSSFTACQGTTTLICSNDECSNALSLIPHSSYIYTSGSTLGATQSQPPNSDCDFIYATANDVWFKFTATCVDNIVQVQSIGDFDPVLEMEDAPCGNLIGYCENYSGSGGIETAYLYNLTIGNDYYIRIYDINFSSHNSTDFQICVKTASPCPPPETYCNNAITLIPTSSCNYISGSTINAIKTQDPLCGEIYPAYDTYAVWYKFTAQCVDEINYTYGEIVKIQSAPGFDVIFQLSSTCSNYYTCTNNTGYGGLETNEYPYLTIGNVYYIRVFAFNDQGNFQICVTHNCSNDINEIKNDNIISIFPNPANDNITIENSTFTKDRTIFVYDIHGQLLIQQTIPQTKINIDVSGFAKGMYYVKVKTENGVAVKKFVKK